MFCLIYALYLYITHFIYKTIIAKKEQKQKEKQKYHSYCSITYPLKMGQYNSSIIHIKNDANIRVYFTDDNTANNTNTTNNATYTYINNNINTDDDITQLPQIEIKVPPHFHIYDDRKKLIEPIYDYESQKQWYELTPNCKYYFVYNGRCILKLTNHNQWRMTKYSDEITFHFE